MPWIPTGKMQKIVLLALIMVFLFFGESPAQNLSTAFVKQGALT
jgi:hypothetical protein